MTQIIKCNEIKKTMKVPLKDGKFFLKTIYIPEVAIEEVDTSVNEDADGKQEEYTKFVWGYAATCRFLNLIEENINEFITRGKNNLFWQTIELKLLELGFKYPCYVCKKKWCNLLRSYKACKENRLRFGRGQRITRFHFYEQMEALMSKINSNSQQDPKELCQIELPSETVNIENIEMEEISDSYNKPQPTQRKRKIIYSDAATFTKAKQSYFKAKNDAYKEYIHKSLHIKEQKLKLYKRKVENDEKKVKALEELVQLFKQEKK